MPTYGPNFQYPEDSAHTSGDRGTVALVVRKDSPAAIAGTDGDYSLLQVDDTGHLRTVDDYDTFEAQHLTLVASTDTTITFSAAVRAVRISNWDITNRVLVKDGAISSDSDSTAARVGKAPTSDVPAQVWFPYATTTINIRSASTNEVTVEGYRGST